MLTIYHFHLRNDSLSQIWLQESESFSARNAIRVAGHLYILVLLSFSSKFHPSLGHVAYSHLTLLFLQPHPWSFSAKTTPIFRDFRSGIHFHSRIHLHFRQFCLYHFLQTIRRIALICCADCRFLLFIEPAHITFSRYFILTKTYWWITRRRNIWFTFSEPHFTQTKNKLCKILLIIYLQKQ